MPLKIILNIAAGTNLLRSNRLAAFLNRNVGDLIVYNLDIYDQLVAMPVLHPGLPPSQPQRAAYLLDQPDVEYSNACQCIDFEDGAADIILAVSPYGFPVLNSETLRVLKRGGYVVVLGNNRNPYACKDTRLFSPDLAQNRGAVEEVGDAHGDGLVGELVEYLLNSYVSSTSHGERTTVLDRYRVWRKR